MERDKKRDPHRYNDFWLNGARAMADLVSKLESFDEARFAENPQAYLTAYEVRPGTLGPEEQHWLGHFVEVDQKIFQGFYDTYLEEFKGR